ncbi:hypothetical protein [Sphingomonas sp. R86521]|uniref:hypothetical protein n=1 Tax=Sphingomonas sp. R86521 TaxID=3093860 RepID=UPI0036D2475B
MYRPMLLAGAAASLMLPHAVRAQMAMPMPADPAPTDSAPMNHAQMDHGKMDHAVKDHARPDRIMPDPVMPPMAHDAMPAMPAMSEMPAMTMGMGGDAYQMGSGTARLPGAEGMMRGRMIHAGDWMLMAHGYAWGVYTDQGGKRGSDKAFVESMAMLMADRDYGDRVHLQLRGMASLEPAMGARGYPNLFATGEVANGQPLVDRQHPHDLVMELSARADYRIGDGSVFVYAAPVGEPALGPSAFMHRGSARYQPLSPITHHWFDSTHITYGVVTAGYQTGAFQLEGSAFKGREPDEYRWNIESPKLDSWSVRGTWTPTANWALQVSHGRLNSPEESHPGEDENRTTASVQYANGGLTTTFAYALKDRAPGPALSALLAEATWEIDRHHAVFGRVENVANDELFPNEADALHDRTFRVTRAETGYAYRIPISGPFGVALGGTVAAYAKPAALDAAYGAHPVSWSLFTKFALGL